MRTFVYHARFEPGENHGIVVSFADVPEAITQGDDEADAYAQAEEALGLAQLADANLPDDENGNCKDNRERRERAERKRGGMSPGEATDQLRRSVVMRRDELPGLKASQVGRHLTRRRISVGR